MVQWLKKLFGITPKPQAAERVLEFNLTKLKTEIENLSSRLYSFKEDLSLAVIVEVVELARNIELLEVNRYKTPDQLSVHRGRLAALSDLSAYIERSKQARPEKQEGPLNTKKRDNVSRDAIRFRKTEHQAGIAI